MRDALRAAAILTLAGLGGCQFPTTAAYQDQVSTWVGRPADDLIVAWGPPARSAGLSDGGRVIEYERQESRYVPGPSYPTTVPAFVARDRFGRPRVVHRTVWHQGPGHIATSQCLTRFRVAANGRIESMNFVGNACVAYPVETPVLPAPPAESREAPVTR